MPNESVLDKPIIIVGAPRSGTTFLGKLLSRHRSLAYIVEPRLTWRYGNDRKSDMLRPEDARTDVRNHIRKTFAQTVTKQGKSRLLEKTPSNALRLDFVDRVFPDCRFVHIIRNGTDSALSIRRLWQKSLGGLGSQHIRPDVIRQRLREVNLRRLPYYAKEVLRRLLPQKFAPLAGTQVWGPRIPGLDALAGDLDLLEVCCLQWRMCVEAARHYGRQLPPDRYTECKLEDLTEQRVRDIVAFCQLEDDPDVWAYFEQHFDPQAASKPQTDAALEDLQTIRRWIEPTMRWLGYTQM